MAQGHGWWISAAAAGAAILGVGVTTYTQPNHGTESVNPLPAVASTTSTTDPTASLLHQEKQLQAEIATTRQQIQAAAAARQAAALAAARQAAANASTASSYAPATHATTGASGTTSSGSDGGGDGGDGGSSHTTSGGDG